MDKWKGKWKNSIYALHRGKRMSFAKLEKLENAFVYQRYCPEN